MTSMKYAELIKIVKLLTNVDITVEDLKKAEKESTPYTIDELIVDPFKEDYSWLISDRPPLIEDFVDRQLDYPGRYSVVDLNEILDYISDVEEYPEDYRSSSKEQIAEARKWLVEKRFGSMMMDW